MPGSNGIGTSITNSTAAGTASVTVEPYSANVITIPSRHGGDNPDGPTGAGLAGALIGVRLVGFVVDGGCPTGEQGERVRRWGARFCGVGGECEPHGLVTW